MAVIGMRFDSLEASRGKSLKTSQIKINSVPAITDVRETSMPAFTKKALSLGFEFSTKYEPGIGSITIKGEVVYLSDDAAKVVKEWKAKKSVPEGMRVEVLNHLFRTCLLKIANLADDLQLPPPVAIPRVRPKESKKS